MILQLFAFNSIGLYSSGLTLHSIVAKHLRRGRYDSRSLLSGRAGIYWRHGGVHLPGIASQVIGMAAAAAWLHTAVWKGSLSSLSDGADFSVCMGAIAGGTLYWLLARRSVVRERGEPAPSAP